MQYSYDTIQKHHKLLSPLSLPSISLKLFTQKLTFMNRGRITGLQIAVPNKLATKLNVYNRNIVTQNMPGEQPVGKTLLCVRVHFHLLHPICVTSTRHQKVNK